MSTQYYTATSLDGFIATEDDSVEWLDALGEGDGGSGYAEFIAEVGAVVMGASTYRWMLAHLVDAEGNRAPWPYTQPVWVFSHRALDAFPGADLRVVRGDVRPVHADMARVAGSKNIWVVGGGELAAQFHDAGLLDEVIVTIGSVTLGRGKPLFPRRVTTPPWVLTAVRQVSAGFVELRYAVPKQTSVAP
ncbi:MAG: dihydrofolate reductase family protein [Gemmatimonadaceae bacterium]|jgi:dihydrofolate reductase|nr:dihydrofolate reductase family protein [Gemmatimonadaceae bacterium]